MREATFRRIPDVGVELYSPYEASFISALKATVPHYARKWQPERKVWVISGEYAAAALRVLREHFTVSEMGGEREQEKTQESQTHSDSSYSVLHLLPTAPPELVRAAYLCLAKLSHPDLGGNTATMQAINRAYETITR